MPEISRRAVLIASSTLLLAILLPRFTALQLLALTPLWSLAVISALLAYAISSVDRKGPSHSSARLRHALRPLSEATLKPTRPPLELSSSVRVKSLLHSVLALIRVHFIESWYAHISPAPDLPDNIEVLIRHVLTSLVSRAQDVDWPTFAMSKLLPILTDHIQHFRSVEHLAHTPALPLPLPPKAHPALMHFWSNSDSVEAHLRDKIALVVDDLLVDTDRSVVVTTIVREVVLGTIFSPILEMLSDGDFWNRQIDEKLGKYIYEQ